MRLHHSDNVVVASLDITEGTNIQEEGITVHSTIPFGHKIATGNIGKGDPIRKYGQVIGFAATEIAPGEHVHNHNINVKDFSRDYAIGVDARPALKKPEKEETFQGIVRPDGRVATRNYIGVLSPVNCSASVTRRVADIFSDEVLSEYPHVDGVVPLCYGGGCGVEVGGNRHSLIVDALAGYANHPNFANILIIGLGCEDCNAEAVLARAGLEEAPNVQTLIIQDLGGTPNTIKKAREIILDMLPKANEIKRQPVSASHLILGLECGGSDAYSGITANPALGAAADRVVQCGGTAVLAETPEIFGAEHLLTRRATSKAVADKLIDLIKWWQDYALRNNGEMNNNPTLGNIAGGISTILEKSLGAAAKGGTTNLEAVYQYAEPIDTKGLVFMDTPGYDPLSITGLVGGGANVVCFTTGRGSAFGGKPVPVLKLSSNSTVFRRMKDDMDINCGAIADGEKSVDEMGEFIFQEILKVASGTKSKSELLGLGDNEFVPWEVGGQF